MTSRRSFFASIAACILLCGCPEGGRPPQEFVDVVIVSVYIQNKDEHWLTSKPTHTIVQDSDGRRFVVGGIAGKVGEKFKAKKPNDVNYR